jgi:hypothetical protein
MQGFAKKEYVLSYEIDSIVDVFTDKKSPRLCSLRWLIYIVR